MKNRKFLFITVLFVILAIGSAAMPEPAIAQDEPDDNPWVLQDWCLTHLGCSKAGTKNKTDGWLQIYLTSNWDGESGFFTIPPKGTGWITLRPGQYTATYVFWCNGKMRTQTYYTWPMNEFWRYDIFTCPWGYTYSIRR